MTSRTFNMALGSDNRVPEITADNDQYHDQEKRISNGEKIDAASDTDNSSEHKQEGVRGVEAVTRVWSKKLLWTTFVL